jgi:thiol-disulfide isomerase/thioredoxin
MTRRYPLIRVLLSLTLLAIPLLAAAADAPNTAQRVKDAYPTLTTGALASARLVDLPAGVVMRSGEIKVTQKDLDAQIGKSPLDVRAQLKRNLFFVLENKATQMFLDFEAGEWAEQNKSPATAIGDGQAKAYLDSLTMSLTVGDDEAKAFYDKNKDMIGEATFDQAKDQIKQYVLSQKQQDAVNAYIAATGERYGIDVDKAWTAKQYSAAMDNPIDKARKSGKPTMVDLGADGCRPCDMMAPILESLKKDYAGKANVLFVHVRKEQILAARYGVQSIPVQVFFDRDGKELFRHVGFFPKDQIVAKLAEMGAK